MYSNQSVKRKKSILIKLVQALTTHSLSLLF